MKIDNYNVLMNASYFNLEFSKTDAQVLTKNTKSSNDTSNALSKIKIDENASKDTYTDLTKELTKSILSNINNESKRLIGNKVEISNTYVEAESLSFSMDAVIQTKDREIELSLDINLSRSFVQTTNIKIESLEVSQAFKDPLILSFDGNFPKLDSKTFSFDIDSDGHSDQISLLEGNGAFLALDKNNNGSIDDGSELFGTKSGDGFSDLSKYDDDKNGWIDENDAIFDKLRVWQKSENKDTLVALGEVGIGAIFLGDTKTPFSLKSETNTSLGLIRSSSMFVYEDGRVGVISQVDFAVDSKTNESLDSYKDVNEKRKLLLLNGMYSNAQNTTSSSDSNLDSEVTKLQKKLTKLNHELMNAKDAQKASINSQIAVINTQMMALLS